MKIFGESDVGHVRAVNQDAFAFGELSGADFAIVCDGMGGTSGGSIASELAVRTIREQIEAAYRAQMRANAVRDLLISSFHAANANVFMASRQNEELSGMGTTGVAALVAENVAYIVHVGDSRAYLLKDDGIIQLTKDHSLVQEMVESGKITQEEARLHPKKNMITRALGVDAEIHVDYMEVSLTPGQTLLLCTDGLSNYLEADDIYKIVRAGVDSACTGLIHEANERGGGDNITVVILVPDASLETNV